MRTIFLRIWILTFISYAALSGNVYAASKGNTPEDVVRAYHQALIQQDFAKIVDLYSSEHFDKNPLSKEDKEKMREAIGKSFTQEMQYEENRMQEACAADCREAHEDDDKKLELCEEKCQEIKLELSKDKLEIIPSKSKKSKDKAFIRISAFWGMAVDLIKEEGQWKISRVIQEYEDSEE